jgi:hypothetical protein
MAMLPPALAATPLRLDSSKGLFAITTKGTVVKVTADEKVFADRLFFLFSRCFLHGSGSETLMAISIHELCVYG